MELKRWIVIMRLGIIVILLTTKAGSTSKSKSKSNGGIGTSLPRRILVDTDVDTDDVMALFYLLKQNKSDFDLQGITINANGWSDSGHGVNHVYDILYMMGRDDIPVGVGGEGSILPNSTILPNVGGFLPIIDQGTSTAGECRYRQSIPVGRNGRLDVNSNFGLRRSFLPQGERSYRAEEQATAQEVMVEAVSAGPISIIMMGAHTNVAIFLMSHPELKKNVEHIYSMGGAVEDDSTSQIGNLFPPHSNPFAEFNFFIDPFAAYTVLHSGIPITLVPLDATNTIPVDESFFSAFERNQDTLEAQYCFQSLKMARHTWINNEFYKQYCMWDSFMVGVALSEMRKYENVNYGMNEFAVMKYVNITVVTSNEPYGISDGSNPILDGTFYNNNLKFGVKKNGVHSGHVQLGMQDQFCLVNGNKPGKCQDGYTKKVSGEEAVKVLIATEAKANSDPNSSLTKEFYKSFLDLLNRPAQSGRFNIRTQFPYYEETLIRPFFGKRVKGKAVVFDMDMSAGDFLALFYLLKLPLELIDLKGIIVSANGWGNAATVDIVYDILHMMGRDDIPVGLGDVFAIGQAFPSFPSLGGCAFTKFIPHGCAGFLDSDTLFGLARTLPRSPRIYTAENSVKFGAPRDTEHPELRQPSALEVWESTVSSLNPGAKVTILTNGPLTNLAQIINLTKNITSLIQDVYIVGGHISRNGNNNEKGNLFTFPSNEVSEFNMFLDPLAAKMVLDSNLNITLIPLRARRQVSSFNKILKKLKSVNKTPEAAFVQGLLRKLRQLQEKDYERYLHVDTFLGEILGAVILAAEINQSQIGQTFEFKSLNVFADQRDMSRIGQIVIEESEGKRVKVLESVNEMAYYDNIVKVLGDHRQSAVIGNFEDQKRNWSDQPKSTNIIYQAIEANFLVVSIVLFFLFAICIRNKVISK